MDVKQNAVVGLNNFCEHSHKIKSEEEKFKNAFCEMVNGCFSVYQITVSKKEELSFKEWNGN